MNKDIEANLLDAFGRLLIEDVHDRSLMEWNNLLSGRAKPPVNIQLYKELSSQLSQEQLASIARIVPDIIGTTLFNFLVMIEQTDWLELTAKADSDIEVSLKDTSDGLFDSLNFWIRDYAKQPKGRLYELMFGTSGPFLSSNRND